MDEHVGDAAWEESAASGGAPENLMGRAWGRYALPDKFSFGPTDTGNADVLVEICADKLRYDHREGRWYVWADHWWRRDADGGVYRQATVAMRHRYWGAIDARKEGTTRSAFVKQLEWAQRSESLGRLRAAVALAATRVPLALEGDEWDRDPSLLAVANGVVDLRNGELRPGRPGDLIRRHSPVAYHPEAYCPRWRAFLDEVFEGDRELAAFLHRAVGYTITGLTEEQAWFFLHGLGDNGKTTLVETLGHVLGSYAVRLPGRWLEESRSDRVASDLAALPGRRMAWASAGRAASTLAARRIKDLTGERPVAARLLHREPFEFTPAFKLWLVADRRPRVAERSHGFWRRCFLIPFRHTFGDAEADRWLGDTLREEAAGILNWAIGGCRAWLEEGLNPPASVVAATEHYREENDLAGPFLAAACEAAPGERTFAGELYRGYLLWCEEAGVEEPLSQNAFGREMGERFEREKDSRTRRKVYLGVRLAAAMAERVAGSEAPA